MDGASAAHSPDVTHAKACGWFVNPTPQNIWLDTATTEWIIGLQGEYQARGNWRWPRFAPGQWVVTNHGGHGYGCACVQGQFNEATKQVARIGSVTARPLSVCRQNAALHTKEPDNP